MEHLINEEKISPSKYKVWNSSKDIEFIVDDEWLDSIPREGINKLVMFNFGEKLEVTYKSGKIIYYQNCHGTWGFPTEFV